MIDVMNYKGALLDPIYLITYHKKNGEERVMRCQVDKDYCEHTSGKKEFVVVFDIEKQDWRTVNTDTITSFQVIG